MRTAVLLVVVGLAFAFSIAGATIPDASKCSVTPIDERGVVTVTPQYRGAVTDPPAGTAFTVNVRNNADEPIPNAFVEIVFNYPANQVECSNIVATGDTDDDGNITFNLAAGGCTLTPDALSIIANSSNPPIRTFKVASPDGDHSGSVSLGDFTGFGYDFGHSIGGCYDFDGNGNTTLGDFTLFGQCFNLSCDPY